MHPRENDETAQEDKVSRFEAVEHPVFLNGEVGEGIDGQVKVVLACSQKIFTYSSAPGEAERVSST